MARRLLQSRCVVMMLKIPQRQQARQRREGYERSGRNRKGG
jgi:hypothetical protein